MSSSPRFSSESGMTEAKLENRLRRAAAALPYPETPDLAARERKRLVDAGRLTPSRKPGRLAVGLALVIILLAAAFLVSPVRARVLDWIRLGAVRIFFNQPVPTATLPPPSGTPSPSGTLSPAGALSPAAASTLEPTPTFLKSVLNIGGETTLLKAQQQVDFTIQIPAYPADLGDPDHVFLQGMNGPVVVLVWMDRDQPEKVRMSLSETSSDRPVFEKYAPKSVQETRVNGHEAVWVDGEYFLVMRDGDATMTRLITQGHTLIWTSGEMTFRLETDVDLETAVRIAQSIP